MDDDASHEGRREAPKNTSTPADTARHEFQAPEKRPSLLGLDRLAAQKRTERELDSSSQSPLPTLSLTVE